MAPNNFNGCRFQLILCNMEIIKSLEQYVCSLFKEEGSGHDWWHIHRVRNNAVKLAENEGADKEITELAALLHDIADHKFHDNDLSIGPRRAHELVMQFADDETLASRVSTIVAEVSFKGAGVDTPVSSLEAACVQDADRLDALGAIGIARAFAYGGSRGRLLYHPDRSPRLHDNFEDYATDDGHTINHFYEKLLLLKDRMQTISGRKMAEERHAFMMSYLTQFFTEWEGESNDAW